MRRPGRRAHLPKTTFFQPVAAVPTNLFGQRAAFAWASAGGAAILSRPACVALCQRSVDLAQGLTEVSAIPARDHPAILEPVQRSNQKPQPLTGRPATHELRRVSARGVQLHLYGSRCRKLHLDHMGTFVGQSGIDLLPEQPQPGKAGWKAGGLEFEAPYICRYNVFQSDARLTDKTP
jgi:hypothetical protein